MFNASRPLHKGAKEESIIRLARTDRNLAQRIYDWLCDTISKIGKNADARALINARRMYENALRTVGDTQGAGAVFAEGAEGSYSIANTRNMPWEKQVRGYFRGDKTIKTSDSLYLGESDVPGVQNSPRYLPTSVVTKAIRPPKGSRSAHALTENDILKLKNGINNAPAVIYNPTRNALIYLTENQDSYGNYIIAAFDLNNDLYGEAAHRATSIHGRENLAALLKNLGEEATVFVKNENKLNQMLPGNQILKSLELLAKVELDGGSISNEELVVKASYGSSLAERAERLATQTQVNGKAEGETSPLYSANPRSENQIPMDKFLYTEALMRKAEREGKIYTQRLLQRQIEKALKNFELETSNDADTNTIAHLSQYEEDVRPPVEYDGDFEDFLDLKISNDEGKAFSVVWEASRKSGFEYGIVIEGGVIHDLVTSNLPNTVGVDLKNYGYGLTLLHSHTNATPLSIADFRMLLKEKVDRIGVVGYNGDAFVAYIGYGDRPTLEEFEEVARKIRREADLEMLNYPNFYDWTFAERNYMVIREQAFRIARHFGWTLEGGRLNVK